MRKPNSIIVLLYIFHIIHPQKQKRSIQPFCFWGEHSKRLSNQADVELDMINAISAADIAFITSSSQAIIIVNWLNALDQSDFLYWAWCIIKQINEHHITAREKSHAFRLNFWRISRINFSDLGHGFHESKEERTSDGQVTC